MQERAPSGAHWFTEVSNLGDLVSPFILEHYLGIPLQWMKPDDGPKWLGVGSVMESALPGDWVWGTGTKFPETVETSGLTVLAVRGPRTASLLSDIPRDLALGDPALLLPEIYAPKTDVLGPEAIGFIPHYVDRDFSKYFAQDATIIDVKNPNWMETVDLIASCCFVISSSLHGIIIAEAYGVSAAWIQPSERILGGHHKFHDYYESTGRKGLCQPWNRNVEKLRENSEPPPDFAPLRSDLVGSLQQAMVSKI